MTRDGCRLSITDVDIGSFSMLLTPRKLRRADVTHSARSGVHVHGGKLFNGYVTMHHLRSYRELGHLSAIAIDKVVLP